MNNYDNFKAIDFVNHQAFRAWVFNKELDANDDLLLWLSNIQGNHHELEKARMYLLNIHNMQPEISEEYVEDKIQDFWKKAEEKNLNIEVAQPAKKFRILDWLVAAASVCLIIGLMWVLLPNREQSVNSLISELFINDQSSDQIEKVNKGTESMNILLPDGSKVTLEPNSSVSYPEAFDKEMREVSLVGEAFFDVVKNPDQPFIVHFNELVVKVLGTSFTISAPKDDNKMQVLVKTGKVSVFENNEWQKLKNDTNPAVRGVIITANQKVEYLKETAKFEKKLVDSPAIINPVLSENDFTFDETPLMDVFEKLERAYGIKIVIDENQVANCTLTATLSDEPLIEKLNLISKIIHGNYEMIDGQIVMNVKSCKK